MNVEWSLKCSKCHSLAFRTRAVDVRLLPVMLKDLTVVDAAHPVGHGVGDRLEEALPGGLAVAEQDAP